MELYIALAIALSVSLGIRLYLRWFNRPGAREPTFERWCRERQLVLALQCERGTGRDVLDALRHALAGEHAFHNRHGGWPWQHYTLLVEHVSLAPDVVGLEVVGCRPERSDDRLHRDLETVVAGLGAVAAQVEEIWLHGQLHAGGRPSRARARMGWLGTLDDEGRLEVTPAIGRPEWLPREPLSPESRSS